MNIFTYKQPSISSMAITPDKMISGYSSLEWIERYYDASSIKIIMPATPDNLANIKINTLIGNNESKEVMIVTSISIKSSEKTMEVNGFGFEYFLSYRVTDSSHAFPRILKDHTMTLPDTLNYSTQIWTLIHDSIIDTSPSTGEQLSGLYVDVVPGLVSGDDNVENKLNRTDVYSEVNKLAKAAKAGIRSQKPEANIGEPLGSLFPGYLGIHVYKGVDRSNSIAFYANTGDLESIDYLFTSVGKYTGVIATSGWGEVFVRKAANGLARRTTTRNFSEVDGEVSDPPTTSEENGIKTRLTQKAKEFLDNQKSSEISLATVSRNSKYKYGKDYNLGDVISVYGDYSTTTKMRVTEVAKFFDYTGYSEVPTLTNLQEELEFEA